ncbi:MAG: AmmeMemoRadiSam system protein B [Deltaproteobacteria bacterium]|nr:AmmeMemoRadiSam system protein B [Deltaproteobacteria bacterium]
MAEKGNKEMRGFFTVAGLMALLLGVGSAVFSGSPSVRPSALSGSWYPADRGTLMKEVDGFLRQASPSVEGERVVAMISPHAGYAYSGAVAAWGYRNLAGVPFRRVIILAPSHYVSFEGVSIPRVEFYETPLGRVRVDRNACDSLLAKSPFRTVTQAHEREHAVEIQLPFLQRTLKEFSLVPIVVGELEGDQYRVVSEQLKTLGGADMLVIASSDFTHFGPRFGYVPFVDHLRENISRLDHGAIDLILKKDWQGFLAYRNRTGATICGFRPIALLIQMLRPDVMGRLLQYRLSGDITGDYVNSVSYASIVFFREDGGGRGDPG